MKKIILKLIIGLVVILLIFSPYLLVIDYKRYAPILLLIWIISIAYYLMMKKRFQHHLDHKDSSEGNDGDK